MRSRSPLPPRHGESTPISPTPDSLNRVGPVRFPPAPMRHRIPPHDSGRKPIQNKSSKPEPEIKWGPLTCANSPAKHPRPRFLTIALPAPANPSSSPSLPDCSRHHATWPSGNPSSFFCRTPSGAVPCDWHQTTPQGHAHWSTKLFHFFHGIQFATSRQDREPQGHRPNAFY